eukprot:9889478-Alexandrium_andersonii.AAC.1
MCIRDRICTAAYPNRNRRVIRAIATTNRCMLCPALASRRWVPPCRWVPPRTFPSVPRPTASANDWPRQ